MECTGNKLYYTNTNKILTYVYNIFIQKYKGIKYTVVQTNVYMTTKNVLYKKANWKMHKNSARDIEKRSCKTFT